MNINKRSISIIGSGWGTSSFIKKIDCNKNDIKIISPQQSFLYTPLLANNLSNSYNLNQNITSLNNKVEYLNDKIISIDVKNNVIKGEKKDYVFDYVIFSHGSDVNTFNIEGVDKYSCKIKTAEDSLQIKEKLSNILPDSNIVVIGASLTGSEIIGNLIDYNKFNLSVIDGLSRPLSLMSTSISDYTSNLWNTFNVNTYFNKFVNKIDKDYVFLNNDKIKYDMVIWCGGIKNSILTNNIINNLNLKTKKGQSIPVNNFLQISDNKENFDKYDKNNKLFAIGDCSSFPEFLPPTAQVASQQGKYLAQCFNNDSFNEKFTYKNKGQFCYIGDKKSVYYHKEYNIEFKGLFPYYANKITHYINGIDTEQTLSFIKSDLFS